jgi:phosphonopyruvate decarboxylase
MDVQKFNQLLVQEGLGFITGVPCSLLSPFLSFLATDPGDLNHIIAAEEGAAMAVAAGHYLATGQIPIVYMQNSGLSNAIDPLTSLFAKPAYDLPAILFITWRGEPNTADEPQHVVMGDIMLELLKILGIPYDFADTDIAVTEARLQGLKSAALNRNQPVALIFKAGMFAKAPVVAKHQVNEGFMNREEALELILQKSGNFPVIATTGKTSREIFELRERLGQSHNPDFLTVGSMGYVSSIGLGVALSSDKPVYVVDGDGAAIMKMGALPTIGHYHPKNLTHIVIDNAAYESTGSQPTVSASLHWDQLFKAVNYDEVIVVASKQQLAELDFKKYKDSLTAIVVRVATGSRSTLGRPTITPQENKKAFMRLLGDNH